MIIGTPQDPAHHWLFIAPFLGGLGAVWFALQSGPFYPRHHTPDSKPTPAWKVRAVYIPLGILFAAVAASHFRFPWQPDMPILRWSCLTALAGLVLIRPTMRALGR